MENTDSIDISVCIPAYERADQLKRLLDSIAIQSYKKFEVVVSDDSKSDAVEKMIEVYKDQFKIIYHHNNPPAGAPVNWNLCILRASFEWIKEMHDDDWFATPDALQQFANAAAKGTNDFIFSACNNINLHTGKERHERLTGKRKVMLEDSTINLFSQNLIGHPSTTLYKKDPSITYDEKMTWVVDIDFYIRYLEKHNGYYYIPEMLINIGEGETQLTNQCYRNPYVEIPEYITLFKKLPDTYFREYPHVFNSMWRLMRQYKVREVADLQKYLPFPVPAELVSIIEYQKTVPWIIFKQPQFERIFKRKYYKQMTGKKISI